jgi:hypothetical protein
MDESRIVNRSRSLVQIAKLDISAERELDWPYQEVIELLAKRDFNSRRPGLLIQVFDGFFILRQRFPDRLAQVCFGQWGFDLLVELNLRGAIQEAVHQSFVDLDTGNTRIFHLLKWQRSRWVVVRLERGENRK